MIQLANHIYSMMELILLGKEIEIKFWEYLLHHFLAVCLIFFSLTHNFVIVGAIVLAVHDVSDVVLGVGRLHCELR
jgi:ceramide synthetase